MSCNKSSPNTSEMRPLRMPREDLLPLSLKYSSKPKEREKEEEEEDEEDGKEGGRGGGVRERGRSPVSIHPCYFFLEMPSQGVTWN